jgi:SAM-dependent methyltransferase
MTSGPVPELRAPRAQVVAEGRELAPWHLDVEISPGLSTREFADAPYDEQAFGKVRLIDSRPRFMRTLGEAFPGGLEGRSVLDVACNCGGFLYWARDAGAGECLGIDVREHWIEQARFLARHRVAPSEGMRFEVNDLYELPRLGLEPCDVTLFNGILYHLPEPLAALRIAADLTRELLIVNTGSRTDLPDGLLAAFEESRTRAISGVYGLSWFPTGPDVVARMLAHVGFPEVRSVWWETLDRQPPGHARLELVAARSADALARFDEVVTAAGPALETALRTRVPPGAEVLVADPERAGSLPAPAHREVVPFPAEDGGDPVAELEARRRDGATHLAIPAAAAQWFEAQAPLRRHVRSSYAVVAERADEFVLHSLLARRADAT